MEIPIFLGIWDSSTVAFVTKYWKEILLPQALAVQLKSLSTQSGKPLQVQAVTIFTISWPITHWNTKTQMFISSADTQTSRGHLPSLCAIIFSLQWLTDYCPKQIYWRPSKWTNSILREKVMSSLNVCEHNSSAGHKMAVNCFYIKLAW